MNPVERALLADPLVLRLGLLFSVVALPIALFVVRERRHLARLGLLYGASLGLRVASEFSASGGMSVAARVFGFIALVLQGFAFLGLAAVVVYGLILRSVRVEAPRILRDLTIAISYVICLVYLFSIHHVDVTGIVATSAVVTAVVGLSLQDVLSNVMGGVALQLDPSIAPGDWVRLGEVSGTVREITWRHTAIETRNGDTLIVPNNVLMKNAVLIQGRRTDDPEIRERRLVPFNVDYRHSPTAVIEAVTEALNREAIPNVAPTPPPSVVLMDFKESWASYTARYWLTDIFLDDPTDSTIRTRIYFALKRAGIPLSIPAQSLFVTPQDSARATYQRDKELSSRIAALSSIALFSTLTAEEKAEVAEGLIPAPFAPGEAIVVQGSAVHHLYILASGAVEVRVSVDGSPFRAVTRLTAPDFFGEMGMLTGETRKATVVALGEVECWRLDKETFRGILAARPQIAGDISGILAGRDVALASVREGLSEEAKAQRLKQQQGSLLERIQRFFGI